MGKKFFLTAAVAALAALGGASAASAAAPKSTDITDFSVKFTSAKLVIAGLLDDGVEVPGSDPALAGKTINVSGVISKGGKVKLAPSGFDFPAISLDGAGLPIPGLQADIVMTKASTTGSVNSTSGAVSIPLSLGVSIGADLGGGLSLSCLIKGLDFTFGTGSVSATGSSGDVQLNGEAWNKTTGTLALTGKANLPDISKLSTSDCSIKDLAAGLNISGKPVLLKLVGTTTIGTKFLTPSVPSVSSSSLPFKGGKGTVEVKCSGKASANRGCAGSVSLTVAGETLTKSFTTSGGKPAKVSLTLSAAQKTAIKAAKSKKLSGTLLVADSKNATEVTKTVSVSNK